MKIVHALKGKAVEKNVPDNEELSLFLSNNAGSFAHFATSNSSKYQGFFARIGGSVFKALESFSPLAEGGRGAEKAVAVENTGYSAVLRHNTFFESFFVPLRRNCIVYQLSRELPVELFFDVRLANDFRQWGRHYRTYEKEGVIIVEFTKKTDSRENGSSGNSEYGLYVAIRHDGFVISRSSEWVKRDYGLDKKRNSASERYVYKAVTITARKFVIAAAGTTVAAVKEADSVFKSADKLKKEAKSHYDRLCAFSAKPDGRNWETAMAANAAAIAIDKLKSDSELYAGLPWFSQEWSRDELVSCTAFPSAARKKIVLKYLDKILEDGRLPTMVDGKYPGSPAGSADSVGWLFKRASDLHQERKFAAAEIRKVKATLKKSIDCLLKHHSKNGFIVNARKETWMDTDFNSDGREGACIEIQAMQLQMYSLMHKLSRNKTYLLLENSLRNNVRKFFWNGFVLADRLNDYTIRPNVFIAAYVYPQLLSKKEWETCIKNCLERLWLDWGGLATIDKSHPNFCSEYTGETNRSYHRGDSWFWLNNLAAIVMAKVNSRKFRHYIEKIAAASAKDILWKGAIGCASELSSAKEQRAEGCLNQAWSNATFLELVRSLKTARS